MWRKEDGKPSNPNEISTGNLNSATPTTSPTPTPKDSFSTAPTSSKASACIAQGIRIKGEITGNEDLFIDGQVEGKITLASSTVTVGPNATMKSDITSREIVVRGRIEGKLEASERIQIWHSARINGDMRAERISIEEGAELHGKMEAGKAPTRFADATSLKKSEAPKVSETPKAKESAGNEETTAPGAAVAGAN